MSFDELKARLVAHLQSNYGLSAEDTRKVAEAGDPHDLLSAMDWTMDALDQVSEVSAPGVSRVIVDAILLGDVGFDIRQWFYVASLGRCVVVQAHSVDEAKRLGLEALKKIAGRGAKIKIHTVRPATVDEAQLHWVR